jgi:hypothetical protein
LLIVLPIFAGSFLTDGQRYKKYNICINIGDIFILNNSRNIDGKRICRNRLRRMQGLRKQFFKNELLSLKFIFSYVVAGWVVVFLPRGLLKELKNK